jgi:hypothetical protein
VVTNRRGATRLGCLVSLLIAVAIAYFAFDVGEVYLRYYRFQDAMRQEARFASQRTDAQIRARLRVVADSLGVPPEGGRIQMRRTPNRIYLWSRYVEEIDLRVVQRMIDFHPRADDDL